MYVCVYVSVCECVCVCMFVCVRVRVCACVEKDMWKRYAITPFTQTPPNLFLISSLKSISTYKINPSQLFSYNYTPSTILSILLTCI